MSSNIINFIINLDGNACTGIAQLDRALGDVLVSAKSVNSVFTKLKNFAFGFDVFTNAIDKVSQGFQSLVGTSLDFEQQQANLRTLLNGDAEDAADEMMKMNALIIANLGINPKEMDAMEYAEAYSEAMWLESFRLKNQAELLAAMFGGKKGKGC
jgi:hypothetical protein